MHDQYFAIHNTPKRVWLSGGAYLIVWWGHRTKKKKKKAFKPSFLKRFCSAHNSEVARLNPSPHVSKAGKHIKDYELRKRTMTKQFMQRESWEFTHARSGHIDEGWACGGVWKPTARVQFNSMIFHTQKPKITRPSWSFSITDNPLSVLCLFLLYLMWCLSIVYESVLLTSCLLFLWCILCIVCCEEYSQGNRC